MELEDYKRKIEALNKEIQFYERKMRVAYVDPHWDSIEELQELVYELPDGMTKFFIYQRIEELKKVDNKN